MFETDEAIYDRFLKERKNSDFAVLLERHRDSLLFLQRSITGQPVVLFFLRNLQHFSPFYRIMFGW